MNTKKVGCRAAGFSDIKRQQGWTLWSLLFVLGVLLFFAYVGMQLVPVYGANGNIVNAMERSVDGQDLRRITRAEIIRKMNSQLYLDGTHQLLDYKNDLKVSRNRNKFVLQVNYERKIPLFFNISVAADFEPRLECSLSGQCTTTSIK